MMGEKVLAMHLDLNEGKDNSVISSEAVVLDGSAKLYLNVSWDSAVADELSIEINESSVIKIITSARPDSHALLQARQTGILFDSIEAALGSKYGKIYRQLITLVSSTLKNINAFKKAEDAPSWYAPAAA